MSGRRNNPTTGAADRPLPLEQRNEIERADRLRDALSVMAGDATRLDEAVEHAIVAAGEPERPIRDPLALDAIERALQVAHSNAASAASIAQEQLDAFEILRAAADRERRDQLRAAYEAREDDRSDR